MKSSIAFLLVWSITTASAQFKQSDFKALHGLEKCWEMKNRKGFLIEQWTKLNDSLLTGKSYQVSDKDTVMLETVQLKYENGIITYTPTVPGENAGKPVTFTLVSISNLTDYLFENKQHDYPQQIIYKLGDYALKVTTRALNDTPEKERHFNFALK